MNVRIPYQELQGFRAPTLSEKQSVAKYAALFYKTRISRITVMISAFAVLGLLFLYGSNRSPAGIAAGAAMFAAVVACILERKRLEYNIAIFEEGNFQVLDGSVCEISANADTPGVCNVRLRSIRGEDCARWNTARLEDISIGTPLLMVCVDRKHIRNGICWVFTPFSMTEEGVNYPI